MALRVFASIGLSIFMVGIMLSGCVTVNVNFPESAVQEATDDYVRELYRSRSKEEESPPVKNNHSTSDFEFSLFPVAYAAEVTEFKISSSKAEEVMSSLKNRVKKVIQYKKIGALGESNDGMLILKDSGKVSGATRQKLVQNIVENENKDRQLLYEEVLASNGMPESKMPGILKSFARSFQAESPSGTWLQSPGGSWSQKR